MKQGHRTYIDPPRTSSVRCTEWIARTKPGHRMFFNLKAPKITSEEASEK